LSNFGNFKVNLEFLIPKQDVHVQAAIMLNWTGACSSKSNSMAINKWCPRLHPKTWNDMDLASTVNNKGDDVADVVLRLLHLLGQLHCKDAGLILAIVLELLGVLVHQEQFTCRSSLGNTISCNMA